MRNRLGRLTDWITDPNHNRVQPILITWTCICLFVMVLYFKIDKPEFAVIWAFFAILGAVNAFRSV